MDSESSGGGKTTLFIVVFFLCVISAVVGYFQFTMSSQQAEAEKKMKDIQAKAEADMAAAKSDEEKREIQRKADLEVEQAKMKTQTDSERATMKAQTDAEKKALADREAKIKAAEAAVNKKLADAAATVKNAQNLQNQAKKVKADADKKNKDAAAAMAKAVASGKAVDKKLADEKKKLAADAKKKVDAANKKAADATKKAKAEAKKALDLKKKLDGIPIVVDVRDEYRASWVRPWGSNTNEMINHNRGRLNSPQGWSADSNEIGRWYQLDNGKIATIAGVAIKGRKDWDQWVKAFKAKYKATDGWVDVDGGARLAGTADRNSLVEVKFAKPVKARYIRIYPQEWQGHMSLRAGLLTNDHNDGSKYKLLNVPGGRRAASSWWDRTWHPENGTLNAKQGWHPVNGAPGDGSEWYELQLKTPTKVAGVAIQGRGDKQAWQWITSFTAKYKDDSDIWKNVDSGFVYTGVSDYDSIVWVPFNTPVTTKAIRIYPKTWTNWFPGRFDLLGFK